MSSKEKSPVICQWCGRPAEIIWVHGHGQCSVCGINVEECCRGEQCENTSGEIDDTEKKKNNMKNLKLITFDLDGTLVDSYTTIFKTTERTLHELGIKEPLKEDEFHKRIGHHFIDIFREMNIPVNDFDEFIEIYKNLYFEFIGESSLYPGTEDLLALLQTGGIGVSLLTTKGQGQADQIIDHFGLRKYFTYVMGRRNGVANKPSAEPLLLICNELKVSPGECMMIGDTELDIRTGKNAGTKTCAALYGYRTKEELENEDPDYIISSIIELADLISIIDS